MLGKKPPPVIGNLTSTWGSVYRTAFADAATTSPRSPLDDRINQSPRGIQKYNLGGVGLGIVAALEKSGCETRANYSKPPTRSNPIPVKPPISASSSNTNRYREKTEFDFDYSLEREEEEEEEDYTFVTRHGPNNKPYTTTRVYCNEDTINLGGLDRRVCGNRNRGNCAVFNISPPATFADDVTGLPGSDFLSCCHLCRKKLHGKDIYMYRGEKAFCSDECRYREIAMDDRKEQYYCSSEVNSRSSTSNHRDSRSLNYSNGDQIFPTGILAI